MKSLISGEDEEKRSKNNNSKINFKEFDYSPEL